MIVVAGPRIDPAIAARADGLEVRPYVHDLYRHLAACDLAVVQGGLTTSMELTANRRPFIYFPLAHHFEQNFHVRHRLERYGAGRLHELRGVASPHDIAAAIGEEIGREVDYRAGRDRRRRARGRADSRRCWREGASSRMRAAVAARRPTGSASATATRRCCSCLPGRSCTRVCGRCRCLTSRATSALSCFDPRGNGRSERPPDPAAYSETEYAADLAAVMDATGTEQAVVVSLVAAAPSARCCSPTLQPGARARHGRSSRRRCRSHPVTPSATHYEGRFGEELDTDEGWAKLNAHYWRRDYRGFIEFFFAKVFTEPHSTKQIEDTVGWGLESDAETLIATALGPRPRRGGHARDHATGCAVRSW